MRKRIQQWLIHVLYQPYLIFLICLAFLGLNLILDRTLFRAFRLSQDLKIVENRIQNIETKNERLKEQIKKAEDPNFVETELRKRLDYTEAGDLIFLFPENI